MFVVKKFDQDDLELYKPSNLTVGNANFFKSKLPGLPDYYFDALESSARREYTEEDKRQAVEKARKEKKELENKLMAEYLERCNIIISDDNINGSKSCELSNNLQSANISE